MAAISTLVDDFNDNTVDAVKWPNSFGTYSETGGRARVACDAGFNAYSSALTYTLQNSAVFLRAWPPAAGGAATEAWAQVLVKSATGGTDLGFELRAITGELIMFSRTGYFDAGAVAITYSATDHAWLRIRETGGNVLWETSPNGSSWTTRRTLASPAYVADVNLEFQLICHRDSGTNDFAEFDNVNVSPTTVIALGTATETDSGQAITQVKTKALGLASESDAARPLTASKRRTLGIATETDTSRSLTKSKTRPLGVATAVEAAQAFTRLKARVLGTATETSTARSLAPATGLQPAVETSTAQPLGYAKRQALGTALAEEVAQPFTGRKAALLGTAAAIETALTATHSRSLALAAAAETNTSLGLTGSKHAQLGVAVETSTAQPLYILPAGDVLDAVTAGTPRTRWQAESAPKTRWAAGAPRT